MFQTTILILKGIKELKQDLEASNRQMAAKLSADEKKLKKKDKDIDLKFKDLATKNERLSKRYVEFKGNIGGISNEAKIFTLNLELEALVKMIYNFKNGNKASWC